jgi:hypothetical protein
MRQPGYEYPTCLWRWSNTECKHSRSSLVFSAPTDCLVKVHMFSKAQNLTVRDTVFHTAARDITIINHYTCHPLEPVRARCSLSLCHFFGWLRWIIIVSFKRFVPMAQFIFGNYYPNLNSFVIDVWNGMHVGHGCRTRHQIPSFKHQNSLQWNVRGCTWRHGPDSVGFILRCVSCD